MRKPLVKPAGWNRVCLGTLTLLVAGAGFCPRALADWGSLRANNRSAHEAPHGGGRAPEPPVPRGREAEAPHNREHAPVVVPRAGHEVEPARRVEIERHTREVRHMDIDEDRRHSYFWFGFHPGMFFSLLPPGYVRVYVGGTSYYYDQGVYYQPTPSGYVVITPPVGAVVPALPPGAETLVVGPTVYYYAAGAFYLPQPQGYVVVAPPLGVTVTALPPGAVPVIVNGVEYYQADGVYFLPNMQNGVTVYTAVQP